MVNLIKCLITMSNITEVFKEKIGTWEFDPEIVHHFSDGLYTKQFTIPKGYIVGQHSHTYSHLSILAKGRVILKTDDYNTEYIAPVCIEIKAGVNHLIEAVEDTIWYCIHHTDEKDINKIDEILTRKV